MDEIHSFGRRHTIPVLDIAGGSQQIDKGMINPGTSNDLSFQALMALTIAATIGAWRPVLFRTTKAVEQKYRNLLLETPQGILTEAEEPLRFADIEVVVAPFVPKNTIIAIDADGREMGRMINVGLEHA